jgi:hypothetical protein
MPHSDWLTPFCQLSPPVRRHTSSLSPRCVDLGAACIDGEQSLLHGPDVKRPGS